MGVDVWWRRWWWCWRLGGVAVVVVVVLTPTPTAAQYARSNWGNAEPPSSPPRRPPSPAATPVSPQRTWWEEATHPRRQSPLTPYTPQQPPQQEPWVGGQHTRLEGGHTRQHNPRLTHTNSRHLDHTRQHQYPPHTRQGSAHTANTRLHASFTPRRRDHHHSQHQYHQQNHHQTPRRNQQPTQRRARQPSNVNNEHSFVQPPRQHHATHHNAIPDHFQHHQQGKRWQKAQHRTSSSSSSSNTASSSSSTAGSSSKRRPNIVLIMTDDQDVELGSLNYMPFLMDQIRDQGAYFPNSYCSTPICCPSRSSLLTGLYIHNHEVYTNNHNCSSYRWRQTHERRSFATYLADAGYRTGYFGKYLNKYNGSHIPAGWHEWAGLIKNSRYYNYTVMRNGNFVKYGDQYPTDYYPHVITNEGLQFLKKSRGSTQPMMLVLSYPAPHGPEDSAPEHSHRFFNATDHNTVSYNYAPNPDKQWLLQFTGRMHDIEVKFTDVLMTKRLQTLQTVDESVAKVVNTLRDLGELDNTFIFYTSDHGYHLGQFGLVKGKSMPFEFDIKVPFLVRGPGVKPGVQVNSIALNIDLAPTFLDIAGVRVPDHMDGRSLLPILVSTWNDSVDDVTWRDSFLVESSGRHREEDALALREARRRNRAQGLSGSAIKGGLYTSKRERLEIICQSEDYRAPCSPGQKWECVQDQNRWRLHKCRRRRTKGPRVKWRRRNCVCEPDHGMGYLERLDSAERRKQRIFLKKHLTQDLRTFNTKFIKVFTDVNSQELLEESLQQPSSHVVLPRTHRASARYRRSTGEEEENEEVEETGTEGVVEDVVDAFVKDEEIRDLDVTIDTLSDELESLESNIAATAVSASNTSTSPPESLDGPRHGCRVTGSTVGCADDVYRDPQAWRLSKVAIDHQIRRLRHQLIVMKDIRKHLRDTRPDSLGEYEDYEGDPEISDDYSALLEELEGIAPTTTATTTTTTTTTTTASTTTTTTAPREEQEGSGTGTSSTPPNVDVDFDDVYTSSGAGDEVVTEVVGAGDGGGEKDGTTHLEEDMEDEEGDVIIYGTDYSAGNSQESRGVEEESSLVEETETETRVEGSAVDEWGGAVSHPSQGNTKFQVFPIRTSTGHRHPTLTSENDTSARSQCWCNPNYRLEHKQAERERKRQERQKLRQERQWVKQRRREMKEKKKLRKIKNNLAQCNYTMLNCYTHDNEHWRTPPLWHDGKFCFCMNAVNNTFWCVRTINQTHNFLFCEFITGLVTYYDLIIDPYQLRNVAFMLSNKRLAELHHRLESLRTCAGAAHCDNLPQTSQSTVRTPQLDVHQPEPHPLEEERKHQEQQQPRDNRVEVPQRKGKEREERRRLREERQRHREERRRLRKENKKWKRHQLQALRGHQVLQSTGSNRRVVRLRRKSRMQGRRREDERRREKRRERKRRKKSRRVRIS